MNKLILAALSLSILSSAAFANGRDNAHELWERSNNQGLQVAAAPAPQQWSSQTQAASDAQVLKANRANYRGNK